MAGRTTRQSTGLIVHDVAEKSRRWAWERSIREAPPEVLPAMAKAVALMLGTYMDKDGRCRPATATVAEKLGIKPSTARTHLLTLERQGYLVVERGVRKGSGITRVGYLATVPIASYLPPLGDALESA
jgi:hypothetical protein